MPVPDQQALAGAIEAQRHQRNHLFSLCVEEARRHLLALRLTSSGVSLAFA
jgi:hypothetical protein